MTLAVSLLKKGLKTELLSYDNGLDLFLLNWYC